MKKNIFIFLLMLLPTLNAAAQKTILASGKCNKDVQWTYDGSTLQFENTRGKNPNAEIPDYGLKSDVAPWIRKKLKVRRIRIKNNIVKIGSCAFANCETLQEVIFEGLTLTDIGWGAFLNCSRLKTISLPVQLKTIGRIAFANCSQLPSVSVPDRCRVGDMAFASCTALQSIQIGNTTILGSHVFATEVKTGNKTQFEYYNKEIRHMPPYINMGNCEGYGLAKSSVERLSDKNRMAEDYDAATSAVDSLSTITSLVRNNTYALIIGNQNYRSASKVTYAIHDARTFAHYCKNMLGLPTENVHVVEDGTKQMILEEELEDWAKNIPERELKNLIVYYAGHGVPDVKDHNKAYILPVDVRGTNPKRGIALDDFYNRINDLAFNMTYVFLDACFSGVNRDQEGVVMGERGVGIRPEEGTLNEGNMIVFSATEGNQAAQGYAPEGHGLFTYFLLKNIKDSQGQILMGELTDQVIESVNKLSREEQKPSVKKTKALEAKWRRVPL